MTSKITKTVGGHFEIDATGSILAPGNRIAVGAGESYAIGTVDKIDGDFAKVRWDDGVTNNAHLIKLDVRVIL